MSLKLLDGRSMQDKVLSESNLRVSYWDTTDRHCLLTPFYSAMFCSGVYLNKQGSCDKAKESEPPFMAI